MTQAWLLLELSMERGVWGREKEGTLPEWTLTHATVPWEVYVAWSWP